MGTLRRRSVLVDQPVEGILIQEARDRAGVSQHTAAEWAGVSHNRWGVLERGRLVKGKVSAGKPETYARMALLVGLTAARVEQLANAADIYGPEQQRRLAQMAMYMRHLEGSATEEDPLTSDRPRSNTSVGQAASILAALRDTYGMQTLEEAWRQINTTARTRAS